VPSDKDVCAALVDLGLPTVEAEGCPVTTTGTRSDGRPLVSPYPVGNTLVTWTAQDGGNDSQSCVQTVVVKDFQPPTITGAETAPASLWPPNHKMVPVTVNYDVTDRCEAASAIACSLDVSSNEPVIGKGAGDTAPDWIVVDPHHVQLRSEKASRGAGRVYSIVITCRDANGNRSRKTTAVKVSHR
jgi:hypothetical protein